MTAVLHDPDMRRWVVERLLASRTQDRVSRLRGVRIPGDQIRDLVILENLESDIVLGRDVHHRRYGLTVGGAS